MTTAATPGLLTGRTAVIHGGGGAIGSAMARAFAAAGAEVFLSGRRLETVEPVARDIVAAGGVAHATEVDALDEAAVERHLATVVDRVGRIDISFDAVGIPLPARRVPAVDLGLDAFLSPIVTYTRAYLVTARPAARHMLRAGSGVIMAVTSTPARVGTPTIGGGGAAMAAVEALTRDLSAELAPSGIRVVGLRPQGLPETPRIRDGFQRYAEAAGSTLQQFEAVLASRTHTKRLSTLAELTDAGVFLASDRAAGLTGTILNLSMGSLDD